MGGHSHGEVAAELALTTIRYYIESSRDRVDVTWPFGYDFSISLDENRLSTAIQLANRQVWKRSEQSPEYAGMGTTVAAVLVREDKAAIGSVGDSRVYLSRNGELKQLTRDDTWVGAMIRQGTLNPEEALRHPMRNVLTQATGSRETIDVQTMEYPLCYQDLLLLSSDGLHGVVDEAAVRSIVAAGGALERMAARLVEAARGNGAPDNVSCILVRYADQRDPQA
ncbi:MAG: serine/threonine-protein phosphatase [Acidobacteria bacterium]|nr:serine/threonine-protein phosphatase [Acidobacteriota bacterium]